MVKKFLLLLLIVGAFSSCFLVYRRVFPVMAQGPNILPNGDFETGTVAPWEGIADADITSTEVYSGNYAVHITGGKQASQRWITVTPGKVYVYSGWFKWVEFSGSEWGYDTFSVNDNNWQTLAVTNEMHRRYERNKWNKLALTFTATTDRLQVNFGVSGPKENVEMYFDDLILFEKTGNIAPTINPTSDIVSGYAPLTVNFSGNASDADGAVQYFSWDFGDGSVEIIENPTHTFYKRGSHTVTFKVWDNDGASVSKSLNIDVSDDVSPTITISSPTSQETFNTTSSSVSLAGDASAQSGKVISSLVWDSIDTDEAGIVNITSSQTVNWNTGQIALKPGKNEIVVTCTDSDGRIDTDSIVVNKQVSGPVVSNISVASTDVRVYEKFEFTFDLETVAENNFFKYDENPPPGVQPKIGVTVEGIFKTPSGKTLKQPGFFYTEVTRSGTGSSAYYEETNNKRWAVRFSPQETGQYDVSLSVIDASGSTTVPVGNFNALPPAKQGFIEVSQDDPRYFEFSNGDLYWPTGPAWGPDYSKYKGTGQNFERPWMGGRGAYSTNWARWQSTAETGGNEGYMARLNFKEHYLGHELSEELFYPQGYRIRITHGDDEFKHRFKADTDYLVKLRLKTINISGPRDPQYSYGFVIKTHGWVDEPGAEDTLRQYPSLIPAITGTNNWHTVISTYRTTSRDASYLGVYLGLYLDNVTSGEVYIDEFSVREVLPDGSLGGELIRNSKADMHTYIEQRPSAYFDWQVEQGEQNEVFFKYVIQDKNDWVPNHLLNVGIFYDYGHGYYQPDGTKAKWHLQQWWRYLIARWGYSTAIHSWELNNEGPPDDGTGTHARAAQEFAKFMHDNDAHPHLATTSFWCCWRPTFWGDHTNFPDVDYADIHEYIPDNDPRVYDAAEANYQTSTMAYQDKVGKPVIRGETGLSSPGNPVFAKLEQPNPGIWYHNLLWAQLNPGGMSDPNYWWSQHFNQINREIISKPFYLFVRDLDVNKGGYIDAAAAVSNANLRAWGQKDTTHGGLHLWVQNQNHTWKNVMDGVSISPQSGTVTVSGFNPGDTFQVEWWDTWTEQVPTTQTQTVDTNGDLIFDITDLTDDLAIRILPTRPVVVKGDVDRDGDVDKDDAWMVLSNFGGNPVDVSGYYDPVKDDKINGLDFGWVIRDWGK